MKTKLSSILPQLTLNTCFVKEKHLVPLKVLMNQSMSHL